MHRAFVVLWPTSPRASASRVAGHSVARESACGGHEVVIVRLCHMTRLAHSHAVPRLWEWPSAMFVSGRLPLAAHPQGGGLGRLTELPKVRGRQRSKPRLLCSTPHLPASDACS